MDIFQLFCNHEFEQKFQEKVETLESDFNGVVDSYFVETLRTISMCHKCKKLNLSEKRRRQP